MPMMPMVPLPRGNATQAIVAVTRGVSTSIGRCELTFLERTPIDYGRAAEQHRLYRDLLEDCGATLVQLSADQELPDCCFVQDAAVVLDGIAVIASMGVASRRREVAAVERALGPYRKTVRLEAPATLEGGDVLTLGKQIFVGPSRRTNEAGIEALRGIAEPLGYEVVPVETRGVLHLQTAVTAIDDETLLVNPAWVELAPFAGLRTLTVPESEPGAANALRIGGTVCLHAGFPRTLDVVHERVYDVRTVDIAEFLKAEAGMSCLSLAFRASGV